MPDLFSPISFRGNELKNRIAVSPMCQYSSTDGFATDWHLVHLGSRAVGGAALVMTEATAIEPRGRISPDDLGMYLDEHIEKWQQITKYIKEYDAIPGIQLAHAGRKGSTAASWKVGSRTNKVSLDESNGGYAVIGPSAVAFGPNYKIPQEASLADIENIIANFAQAAQRAVSAGFKWIEIHAAHGYLLHSFYSPLSNFRADQYGGSFENRIRLLLEVVKAVSAVIPEDIIRAVRLSASDWVDGGWSIDDSVRLSRILKTEGIDLIDASSGYIRHGDNYNYSPGWQVPLAEAIKKEAGIATGAVGLITQAEQANEIIRSGKADLVFLAREMIRDPYWPYRAALTLKADAKQVLPLKYSYAI